MTELAKKLYTADYDPRDVPIEEKKAITAGMSMTEKQGGSDVRANTTMAIPEKAGNTGNGQPYRLTGHKDKLGDRANASSEVEYDGAFAQMLGEEHPLMQNLLADLCVESEAHTLTAMYLAAAYDASERNTTMDPCFTGSLRGAPGNQIKATLVQRAEVPELFRVGVAVGKYWVTKRYPTFAYECMEAFGGNGFVEDFPMATLYRQSPLNAIWEGSGNVIALDVLRAHKALPVLIRDIKLAGGVDDDLDTYISAIERDVLATNPASDEAQRKARNLVDRLAVAMQASILVRYGDPV
ncbi:aidB, partial [Symbiodinium microadriaticum]